MFYFGHFVTVGESSPLLKGWALSTQCIQLSKIKRETKAKVFVAFVCEKQKEGS